MKNLRFNEIQLFIPHAMSDETRKEADDWRQFSTKIDAFNKRRKDVLFASHVLAFDELMCAFLPR